MKIVLATKNKHKAGEIREILKEIRIETLTLEDFPALRLPPEEGAGFRENALGKARFTARATGLPALADDSGLEVDSLGGRPGVRSARYAGPDATDRENLLKLLAEMKCVPRGKRGARFRCVVAFVLPDGAEDTFEGVLEGAITEEPAGAGGFGYDPVFFIREKDRTAAELTPREKNAISHRAKALKKFKKWLEAKSPGGL